MADPFDTELHKRRAKATRTNLTIEQADIRLAMFLSKLRHAMNKHGMSHTILRNRTYYPGPNQLAHMTVRSLARETMTVLCQDHSARRDRALENLRSEYRRRGLSATAEFMLGAVAGAAAVGLAQEVIDDLLRDEEFQRRLDSLDENYSITQLTRDMDRFFGPTYSVLNEHQIKEALESSDLVADMSAQGVPADAMVAAVYAQDYALPELQEVLPMVQVAEAASERTNQFAAQNLPQEENVNTL